MASNNFINECKKRANANRLGKIIIDGVNEPITNSNNLQSLSIDSGCYANGNIIGSVYLKCLKANFIDALDTNIIDNEITAQIGVKYADNSTEYIEMGKYLIEHPSNEITAKMSQITAYDKLYKKIDDKYICNIDYSKGNITLKDLYIDVCLNLGLTPITTDFLNKDIPIYDNPFKNGEKNRTVLMTIATISCSFVVIDNENSKIDLCWLSTNETPDYTFEKNDYVSVEGGDITLGPINSVTIKNSQIDDENVTQTDSESILSNGEHSIIISEDYILYNSELRQQAMTAIFNRLNGLKYTNCKLTTYYGKPFLPIGAKLRIYTEENKYIDTYNLKHNFTFDGTFTSVIESPVLTSQEIKTKQNISLGQALFNTQIEVNKQKGEISSLTSKTNELDVSINNNYQEIQEKFNGYTPVEQTIQIENSVTNLQTNTYTKTEINTKLTDGSVTKVVTTSGTFDEEGLHIAKTGEEMESLLSNKGLYVDRDNENILTADNTGVNALNLHSRQYLSVGSNSRWEDYEDGTGCFDIE